MVAELSDIPIDGMVLRFDSLSYTHGMEDYLHLDFQVVINFSQEHLCYLLNTMAMRVKNGEAFHDGGMVSGLYTDCDIRLKKVRETGRDVLRLIIPDKYNCFPDEPGCMKSYKHQEQDMFDA